VAAGLDERITACVANHPALSDMARFRIGEADGYPHFSRMRGMATPGKLRTMACYDVVNFARQIACPTFLTWGYNDDTCPPTTSYAVYNVLQCPKEALITPVNEHWTSDETGRRQLEWILRHLVK
ncbi:MAG: acetylxylan esterase, partial [Alistipes sp.]|nr:acetylxylan esterase [Alistipes sp.]